MKKKFNIKGVCLPQQHYMMDTSKKLEAVLELIEEGEYFTPHMQYTTYKQSLNQNGFAILPPIFTNEETAALLQYIESKSADISTSNPSFIQTKNLFAIRQLLKHLPNLRKHLFIPRFLQLLDVIGGKDYFLTKAIYFNKPKDSNWFVPYHQDLSISVTQKADIGAYSNWTFKRGQYGVHPPMDVLEDTFAVRIHLDDTDEHNGALKVIPQSHLQGVIRSGNRDLNKSQEVICRVKKGGVMLMKPLTLHASNKTRNDRQRRVIHLEFCNRELVEPLEWLEKMELKK